MSALDPVKKDPGRGWGSPGRTALHLAVLVVLGLLFPLLLRDRYSQHFAWNILFWALAASAWNIAGGYAGQFSLGHAAFLGIGAYSSTLLKVHYGMSPWAGMVVGGVIAALFAAALGYLTLRLRGPFFVLVTIAFAEVLRIVAVYWSGLTHGSEGISIPFEPGFANMMFPGRLTYLYIVLGALFVVFLIADSLRRSRLGYHMAAMREDEDAAETLGVDTIRVKLVSIALSAFFTAVAGTLYAQYILFIEPATVLGINFSIQVALISIIGGMGTSVGPILGSLLMTPLGEILRAYFADSAQGLQLIIYGTLLIVIVIFMPRGLAAVAARLKGYRARPAAGRA
jgi:branched-chain amino acid transport system permease protein